MRQQRWLAVWLNNWPVQRQRCGETSAARASAAKPAEAPAGLAASVAAAEAAPLLLWDEEPRGGRSVMAACETCQRLGIQPGMPLHEAVELAHRAAATGDDPAQRSAKNGPARNRPARNRPAKVLPPQVQRYDPAADRQALGRLADALLLEISPLVAIEPEPERGPWAGLQRSHSETLLINITGIGQWFGSEQAVLQATRRLIERQGLRAAMAIADTSAAAWGIVRFGVSAEVLVPAEQTAEAVDPLPVRSLRITAEVAHQLDRLGIQNVRQLRQLPRSGLATRLGDELVRRIDQMIGTRQEPLVMHHSEPEDVAVCELEYPTSDLEILRHRVGQLIDTLAARLSAGVRGALRLSCHLEMLEHHPPRRIDVGLFAPTADAEHLRRLMMTSLEGKQLPAMVQRVSVSVDLAGPLRQFQGTLFGEQSASEVALRRGLARMIETVAMRLGRDAVLAVSPSDHPLPESAYALRCMAGQSDEQRDARGRPNDSRQRHRERESRSAVKSPRRSLLPASIGPLPSDPLRRPLRLFARPLSIAVVMSATDGVLTHLQIGGLSGDLGPGRTYRVLKCCGPERLETGSAAGGAIRRDYYRVEIEGGIWLWLFRHWATGAAESWHLHGRFD